MSSKTWQQITVKELVEKGQAEIKTGPFGTQLHASDYVEIGTPVINARNIGFGTIREEKLEYISNETVKRLSSHLLRPADIVFGRKGTVERHVFIRPEQNNWFQGTDCLRLRLKSPHVEPRYVSYYLTTENHKQWMINQSSHGATMTSLNQDIVSRISLALPPLPIQRKIADVLSAYDDLIEVNTRRIRILEQMAQSVYRKWFGKVDVQSPPEGWEIKQIADVAEVKGGKRLPKGRDVIDEITNHPYLRVRDFTERGLSRDGIKYIDEETYKVVKNYTITSDDIYISIAGTIGRVGIVPVDYSNANLTENAAKICNLNPMVNKYFLLHFLQSSEGQKQIASRVVGTSQPKLA